MSVCQSVGRSESHSQNSHLLVNATFLSHPQLPHQPLLLLRTNMTASSAVVAAPLLLPHHWKEGSNLGSSNGSMSRLKAHVIACILAWVGSQHTSFHLELSTTQLCATPLLLMSVALEDHKSHTFKLSLAQATRYRHISHTHNAPSYKPACLLLLCHPYHSRYCQNYEKRGRTYKAARG